MEVWEEKVGLKEPKDLKENSQVKYGTNAEDFLVNLFKLDYPEYNVKINKKTVYKRSFMFASLDGELTKDNEKGILEIKTTEIHSKSNLEKWNNKVPDYYYCQLLHYFIVTNWKFAILKAQIKQKGINGEVEILTRHYKFFRKDLLEDLKYLYLKEKEFWGYVERKERPPLILPNF